MADVTENSNLEHSKTDSANILIWLTNIVLIIIIESSEYYYILQVWL